MKSYIEKTVQFSTKGQVVIPAKVRREFEIKEGTKASITVTPEGILLRPITRSYIRSLRGSLKGTGLVGALQNEKKEERRKVHG